MNKNIVYRFQVFFFKAHYVALFYAFLIVPSAILGGFAGLLISYPFILLALFAPIGPVSIALEGLHLCTLLPSPLLPPEFYPGYNPLLVIIIVISFKFPIYVYLRRTKVAGKSTPLILSIATLATCIISTLAWWHIAVIPASLAVTISMDLTVFSYVKYRDALNGMASRKWLLVLLYSGLSQYGLQ